jgi:hypothetical protein
MGWNDFYRRRDALDAVLDHARRDPAGALPFHEVPEVAQVFASEEALLLALHYKWIMALTGRVGVALAEAERNPEIDRVDAVSSAWRATATELPELRRLLDEAAEVDAMRTALEGEQRLLALAAGLAEPGDTTPEITRVGGTYLALLRAAPERPARRRGPVEQLLRRLVASA